MKKTLLFLILGLGLTTYSQGIEKMDKKELRIALKNCNTNKDSLVSINSNKDKELALLNENLIASKDSIKAQKVKITSLLSLKKQSDENSKVLSEKLTFLNNSIIKMNANISFTLTSFSLKTLPKNCCMVYSESKELYKTKKYICYWGENDDDTSLNFYLNDEKIVLKRIDTNEEEEEEESSYCYLNEKYLVKIRKRKTLFQDDIILIKESAELFIKNLITGQEIVKKIYGEGGC
jgi:hypothetical protein